MNQSEDSNLETASESVWYLEGLFEGLRRLRRLPIQPLPFRIGRRPSLELSLTSDSVSQEHAEISQIGSLLRIRDLGSTNGTFVNSRPVTDEVVLIEGDVLHIAELEFIVGRGPVSELEDFGRTTEIELALPTSRVGQVHRLRRLIDDARLKVVFQPIVSLSDGSVLGYEALGRASAEGLPGGAQELLAIASSIGAEAELSRLFRSIGVDSCEELPGRPKMFFNTHPSEFDTPGLVDSLALLRKRAPIVDIVVEVHEIALTEPDMIRRLRSSLSDLGIGLAYDDFGTGRARLVDVVEVPPDYLKFDLSLIRGIDQVVSKQKMIESLVDVALDLGIVPMAEGIETIEEADTCRRLGFHYGQGYLFGRPQRAAEIVAAG